MFDQIRRTVRLALGLDPTDVLPVIDRLAFYRAEVKAAASDGSTVDVQPEDSRVKGHQGVPVRVGIPGAVAVVQPGAIVLLGWERGDPAKPYAVPAWESGATVTKLILNAQMVYLGAESGAEALVKKSEFDAHLHSAGTYTTPSGAVTLSSGAPTAPATGTTQVKGK
jgi:hypothetical protein